VAKIGAMHCKMAIMKEFAYAFLDRVFSKFGIPIETLINQHMKFCGKF
jgi:hypothetical protein